MTLLCSQEAEAVLRVCHLQRFETCFLFFSNE
jgi:hypothetical protein